MAQRSYAAPTRGHAGKVRIIGGEWRRRTINFDAEQGVRPTADRTRETLFNWLDPVLGGARCWDVFAGSGVLGFEAASRGAQDVLLTEMRTDTANKLRAEVARLGATQVHVECVDAVAMLERPNASEPYDIVFLDPPFDEQLLPRCVQGLEKNGWLSPDALLYLEMSATVGPASADEDDEGIGPLATWLPANWQILREKRAGGVMYYLASRAA